MVSTLWHNLTCNQYILKLFFQQYDPWTFGFLINNGKWGLAWSGIGKKKDSVSNAKSFTLSAPNATKKTLSRIDHLYLEIMEKPATLFSFLLWVSSIFFSLLRLQFTVYPKAKLCGFTGPSPMQSVEKCAVILLAASKVGRAIGGLRYEAWGLR